MDKQENKAARGTHDLLHSKSPIVISQLSAWQYNPLHVYSETDLIVCNEDQVLDSSFRHIYLGAIPIAQTGPTFWENTQGIAL